MPKSSRSRRWSTTILIADDEPAILYATAMFLKGCGYDVVTAEDGEEALKAFAEAPQTIQLVISDVVMPGIQGPQLVRSIKNLSPSTAALLMSGTWNVPERWCHFDWKAVCAANPSSDGARPSGGL